MFASFMSKFELEKFGAIQIFFLCITNRDVIVDILKIKLNFIEIFNFSKSQEISKKNESGSIQK